MSAENIFVTRNYKSIESQKRCLVEKGIGMS